MKTFYKRAKKTMLLHLKWFISDCLPVHSKVLCWHISISENLHHLIWIHCASAALIQKLIFISYFWKFQNWIYHIRGIGNSIAVEKNGIAELEYYSGGYYDTLTFSWIMNLQKGDTIQMKVTRGLFACGSYVGCIFNGKFIRQS